MPFGCKLEIQLGRFLLDSDADNHIYRPLSTFRAPGGVSCHGHFHGHTTCGYLVVGNQTETPGVWLKQQILIWSKAWW